MKIRLRGDKYIWIIVLLLAMASILAVYSSSSFLVRKMSDGLSKTTILFEQLKSVLMGFIALFICYLIKLKYYRGFAYIIFGVSVFALLLLFVPHFQAVQNGAVRGLKIGGQTFQVFEVVKVGLVIFLAKNLEKYDGKLNTFRDYFFKLLIWVLLVCCIIMINSFSSALLLGVMSLLLMYFMGVRARYLLLTVGIVFAAGILLFGTYKLTGLLPENIRESKALAIFNRFGTVENRVKIYFTKEDDLTAENEKPLTEEQLEELDRNNRQSENAKIAIYQGGIIGKGPGKGTQRYSLSMAFSDFIYASIIEEYGLIGGIFIIFLYLAFLFRCITIVSRCNAVFSSALVLGLSFLITIQAFLHIMVNVGLLPITGHTLPLISHGGTAYLVLSGAFGIILSVSRTLDKQEDQKKEQETLHQEELDINNKIETVEENKYETENNY